jgi:hypothetical protein
MKIAGKFQILYTNQGRVAMSTIKIILRKGLVAGLIFTVGYVTQSSYNTVQASIDTGSLVQINQPLEIPNGKSRLYFQNGVEITQRNIEKMTTYCSIRVRDRHKAGEPKIIISPEQIEIIKLRRSNDYTGGGRRDESPANVIFELEMRLKSTEQPGVMALYCAKQVLVFNMVNTRQYYPNNAEIITALGDTIEIKSP